MENGPENRKPNERRAWSRKIKIKNYRIEMMLIGEPIYQFKVRDVSLNGAGFLVKENSNFLNLIEVGQVVKANLLSPTGDAPSGIYKAEIKHITTPRNGKHKGHLLVGVCLIEKE